MTRQLKIWEIDGEGLIVAHSERDMRAVYLDYHGESIRGHMRRLVPPDEILKMTFDGDEDIELPAHKVATVRGYIGVY